MQAKLAFVIACVFLVQHLSAESEQTVANEVVHYRVSFPMSWTVWNVTPDGTLSASTYPKSRAAEGGLVPPGEAVITLFSNDSGPTVNTWIEESLRSVQEVQRRNVIVRGRPGEVGSYVQVESREDVAPRVYHRTIGDYFTVKGHLLAARLEFTEGDPRESAYRLTLDHVVRSLTAFQRSSKKPPNK